MSRIIIGLHGLGNKPEKELLEKWWLDSIKEGLHKSGVFIFKPKFELIYWADVLHDKPLDQNIIDKDDPQYLDEPYQQAPIYFKIEHDPKRKKVLDAIEKYMDKIFLNDDLSINYSFISDFIIHKYFKDLEIYYKSDIVDYNYSGSQVKKLIRERVITVLKKHNKKKILFIAHSMGSIVAYDVLTFNLPDTNINTFVTIGSPLGMPIIMSKIAAEAKLELHKPHKLTTPPSVTKQWYNFSDLEDKVAMNYNLADDYASNENGVSPVDFIVDNDYVINNIRNPHKSFGYIRRPEFTKIIFDFLIEDRPKMIQWILIHMNNLYKKLIEFILG